jgi:hypothetical protein
MKYSDEFTEHDLSEPRKANSDVVVFGAEITMQEAMRINEETRGDQEKNIKAMKALSKARSKELRKTTKIQK